MSTHTAHMPPFLPQYFVDIIGKMIVDDGSDEREMCVICREKEDEEYLSVTHCKHKFHFACLKNWWRRYRSSCPICKENTYIETRGKMWYLKYEDILCDLQRMSNAEKDAFVRMYLKCPRRGNVSYFSDVPDIFGNRYLRPRDNRIRVPSTYANIFVRFAPFILYTITNFVLMCVSFAALLWYSIYHAMNGNALFDIRIFLWFGLHMCVSFVLIMIHTLHHLAAPKMIITS